MAELFGLRFGNNQQRGRFIETRAGTPLFSWGGISSSSWLGGFIREPFTGAWQRNQELRRENSTDNFAIYACVSRIAADIAKCPAVVKLKTDQGIFKKVDLPLYSNVLRKPNRYQNWTQFIERWVWSKLVYGNSIVYKERDGSGRVLRMHVMDPEKVQILISPEGDIWYQYTFSAIDGGEKEGKQFAFPSYDIIHDRCPIPMGRHPLIGVSPLAAALLAAGMGQEALRHASRLFFSGRPGGVLEVPKHISKEQAQALQTHYQEKLAGDGASGLFVISDGMKFTEMTPTAQDNLAIQSVKLSADIVCAAFGVPKYFVLGTEPAASAIEPELQRYFSQCLQTHIESIENLLDEALEVDTRKYSIELDLSYLLRMDSRSRWETHKAAIACGAKKPNEVRAEEDLDPVEGGDACYLQQQNFSLAALAKRDAQENPFSTGGSPTPTPTPETTEEEETEEEQDEQDEQEVEKETQE